MNSRCQRYKQGHRFFNIVCAKAKQFNLYGNLQRMLIAMNTILGTRVPSHASIISHVISIRLFSLSLRGQHLRREL